jgi:hypothetical protein
VLDPLHYLAALARRPAELDHAPVYRDWRLPAAIAGLRGELEARHGSPAGTRQYIRVLQLLAEHPRERVERAVASCRTDGAVSADAIAQRARALAITEAGHVHIHDDSLEMASIRQVAVPPPDLSQFNRLLGDAAAETAEPRAEGPQS